LQLLDDEGEGGGIGELQQLVANPGQKKGSDPTNRCRRWVVKGKKKGGKSSESKGEKGGKIVEYQ